MLACYVINTSSEDVSGAKKCLPQLEDYEECLHHRKEVCIRIYHPDAPLTLKPTGITDTHGAASIPKGGSRASEGKRAEDWPDTKSGAVGARGGHEGCVGRGKYGEVGWGPLTWQMGSVGVGKGLRICLRGEAFYEGWDVNDLRGAVEGSLAALQGLGVVYAGCHHYYEGSRLVAKSPAVSCWISESSQVYCEKRNARIDIMHIPFAKQSSQ